MTTEVLDKVLYTARTHTVGGREGSGKSDDGRLNVKLDRPGAPGDGTNPEQLFAVGWSACFEGALAFVAAQRQLRLPPETAIDAEVDLRQGEGGFSLAARLNISIPGIERNIAEALIEQAHQTCPYSKATRGNIDVEIKLV